ncbi:hypothetical protein M8C21_015317, partial [Ambrosia artemisiifolia]
NEAAAADHHIIIKDNKRKAGASSSAKKPPKPPRPPHSTQRSFSLDAAAVVDHKLIKELAMIKRARLERMRALLLHQKKPNNSKPSNSTSFFAIIFTIILFILVLFQGMSCQISCGTFQQGSPPPPLETNETAFIFIREELNPSAHDSV